MAGPFYANQNGAEIIKNLIEDRQWSKNSWLLFSYNMYHSIIQSIAHLKL